MSVVTLLSVGGAPGVTTLACALGAVWPPGHGGAVVAECDPHGGDLAARFGLSPDVGMTSLVVALRGSAAEPPTVDDHLQVLPGGLSVLCGPVGADSGLLLDRELGAEGTELARLGVDLIVDGGRLGSHLPGQEVVVAEATRVVLLIEPEAGAIARGRWAAERLLDLRGPHTEAVVLVVSGSGYFDAEDIAGALGVRLAAVIPRDKVAASVLRGEPGGRRALTGSPLIRAAKRLAGDLAADLRRGDGAVRDAS